MADSRLAHILAHISPCDAAGSTSTTSIASQQQCKVTALSGKAVCITGAASGIGRASAILYTKEGANVLCCDVDTEGLAETVRLCNANGCGVASSMAVDVSSEKEVEAMVENCVKQFGGIDVMVANAGVSGGLPSFLTLTQEDWEYVMRINVFGVAYCAKHAAKKMLAAKKGGSIILTASVAGIRSGAGPTHYSASKAAVINLAETIAWQLTGSNIRVNAVCPGIIETGMTKPVFDMARQRGTEKKIGQLNPLRRYAAPEEVGQVILFLGSPASSYINGQKIAVDGGLSASHPVVPGKLA